MNYYAKITIAVCVIQGIFVIALISVLIAWEVIYNRSIEILDKTTVKGKKKDVKDKFYESPEPYLVIQRNVDIERGGVIYNAPLINDLWRGLRKAGINTRLATYPDILPEINFDNPDYSLSWDSPFGYYHSEYTGTNPSLSGLFIASCQPNSYEKDTSKQFNQNEFFWLIKSGKQKWINRYGNGPPSGNQFYSSGFVFFGQKPKKGNMSEFFPDGWEVVDYNTKIKKYSKYD